MIIAHGILRSLMENTIIKEKTSVTDICMGEVMLLNSKRKIHNNASKCDINNGNIVNVYF